MLLPLLLNNVLEAGGAPVVPQRLPLLYIAPKTAIYEDVYKEVEVIRTLTPKHGRILQPFRQSVKLGFLTVTLDSLTQAAIGYSTSIGTLNVTLGTLTVTATNFTINNGGAWRKRFFSLFKRRTS